MPSGIPTKKKNGSSQTELVREKKFQDVFANIPIQNKKATESTSPITPNFQTEIVVKILYL